MHLSLLHTCRGPTWTRTLHLICHDQPFSLPCHGQLFHLFCGRWRCCFHSFSESYGNTCGRWQLCTSKYCRYRKSVLLVACICELLLVHNNVWLWKDTNLEVPVCLWDLDHDVQGHEVPSAEWCKFNRHWLFDTRRCSHYGENGGDGDGHVHSDVK